MRSKNLSCGIAGLRRLLLAVALAIASSTYAHCQNPDLGEMTIDQLSKIDVTSVSRKEQPIGDVATAIYVITQNDIRNSTASTLPELLRTVPGLDVAQINGTTWAVSARGFSDPFADKMLVLIDGHSIFDPLFSGVFWSQQNMPLDDIERIEIIRGPGETVWGTNAVNGVINVITKTAADTQGTSITLETGNRQHLLTTARYGGTLGKSTRYRIYSKYADNGPAGDLNGLPAHDSSRYTRGGFRLDSKPSDANSFMLEGEIFSDKTGVDENRLSYTPPYSTLQAAYLDPSGEDFLGRWTHTAATSETMAQVSYAHAAHPETGLDVNGNVTGASLQHSRLVAQRHNIVTGVEYSLRSSTTSSILPGVSWTPSNPHVSVASGFVQDEIVFLSGTVHVTVGGRLDRNSLSGVDLQPNARILWKINSKNSIWAAYSQGHRGASPDDTSLDLNAAIFPTPVGLQVVRIIGNPNIHSEKLQATEFGYRTQPTKTVSIDVATFFNHYSDLVVPVPAGQFTENGPPARTVNLMKLENGLNGTSFGGEFVAKWIPVKPLALSTSYSFFEFSLPESSLASGAEDQLEAQTPRHQFRAGSSLKLSSRVGWNTWLAFVDRRPSDNIAGYTQVDSSVVWHAFTSSDFSVGARNLFNKEHFEISPVKTGPPTLLGRSFYGKLTWHSRN